MNRIRRALAIVAGTLTIALGLFAGLFGEAHASTGQCADILGPQCGTFQGMDNETTSVRVFWDVKGGVAASNNVVIGYGLNSNGDSATDITPVKHRGNVPGVAISNPDTISYSFVFTPRGHWSNLCIADTGIHILTLRPCNGQQWQRFFLHVNVVGNTPTAFDGSGNNGTYLLHNSTTTYSVQSAAFRTYVQDEATVPPAARATPDTRVLKTDVVGTSGEFKANQLWAFVSA
jgi:hypothetical protein